MAQFELTLEAPLDIEAIVDTECERLGVPGFNDAADWQDRLARTLVRHRLDVTAEIEAAEDPDARRFWQGELEIFNRLLAPLENKKPIWPGGGKNGRGASEKFLDLLSTESRKAKTREKAAQTEGDRLFSLGQFEALQKTRERMARLLTIKSLTGKRGYRAKR